MVIRGNDEGTSILNTKIYGSVRIKLSAQPEQNPDCVVKGFGEEPYTLKLFHFVCTFYKCNPVHITFRNLGRMFYPCSGKEQKS